MSLPEISSLEGHALEILPNQANFGWQNFKRSKVAELIENPLVQLRGESEMKAQLKTKQSLKKHLAERNDGFVIAENPILADRYEYKLNLLRKNIDLAQEGRLTYEEGGHGEPRVSMRQSNREQPQDLRSGRSAEKAANFVLDTSVLVKPS